MDRLCCSYPDLSVNKLAETQNVQFWKVIFNNENLVTVPSTVNIVGSLQKALLLHSKLKKKSG